MNSPSSAAPFNLVTAARLAAHKYGFLTELPADAAKQLAGLSAGPSPAVVGQDLRTLLWSSIDDDHSRDLDQLEVADSPSADSPSADSPSADSPSADSPSADSPSGDSPGSVTPTGGTPAGDAPAGTRIRVAIADVDVLVPRGSPLDVFAGQNATTVYTGVTTFPMLPELLSTDRTSLAQNSDREALIIEFVVASDGSATHGDVIRGAVRNQAKLAYDSVGAWLNGSGTAPSLVAGSTPLAAQLRLQSDVAKRLRQRRIQHGALEFQTIQATPVIESGKVVELHATTPSPARDLIEEFMVAANITLATFISSHQRSSIRRVVRTPKRWPRIVEMAKALGTTLPATPDGPALATFLAARLAADPARFPDLSLAIIKLMGPGEYIVETPGGPPTPHFGLAVDDYTHGTAPNRRYADLITQRIVKAIIAGAPPPYTDAELTAIATHCTLQEDNARHAARLVSKQAAAVMLASHVGTVYDAVVTGVTDQGTYARLFAPPVEGRVMAGADRLDVGDRIRAQLMATDPTRGFIDLRALPA
jgi:VacB/RNase II family 3'-5' exoribonuclease